jgi:hypothetical protein
LGEYRRQATRVYRNHEFFRLDNQEALVIRNKCAQDALEDVIKWIEGGGEVAVSIFIFSRGENVCIREEWNEGQLLALLQ